MNGEQIAHEQYRRTVKADRLAGMPSVVDDLERASDGIKRNIKRSPEFQLASDPFLQRGSGINLRRLVFGIA